LRIHLREIVNNYFWAHAHAHAHAPSKYGFKHHACGLLVLLLLHRRKQHVKWIGIESAHATHAHAHAHAHRPHVMHMRSVSTNSHLQLKIISAAFFRIAQYVVCLVDFLERAVGLFRISILVGMVLH